MPNGIAILKEWDLIGKNEAAEVLYLHQEICTSGKGSSFAVQLWVGSLCVHQYHLTFFTTKPREFPSTSDGMHCRPNKWYLFFCVCVFVSACFAQTGTKLDRIIYKISDHNWNGDVLCISHFMQMWFFSLLSFQKPQPEWNLHETYSYFLHVCTKYPHLI